MTADKYHPKQASGVSEVLDGLSMVDKIPSEAGNPDLGGFV